MDRRDFLRAAGTAAAGGYLVTAAGGTAAAERPDWHRLWREYLATPDTHPRIPNVSYAGYHRGEDRLPTPRVRFSVTGFGAVGDGRTDCTAAFNAAVEAAGRAGGGAVYIPSGEYLLTNIVWVHHSNVVLRGAGRGRTTLLFDQPLATAYRPSARGGVPQVSVGALKVCTRAPRRNVPHERQYGKSLRTRMWQALHNMTITYFIADG